MRRPPGLRLDSGGVAKGLFADLLALELGAHDAFAVDCAGDLRVGGAAGMVRPVRVADPFDGHTLHIFELVDRGVATSGIGRRSWLDGDARPAHHLLDPTTGRPAFTGVVQATAVGLRPLERIGRTAGAIAAGDLSRRVEPATERTEVGRLGLALNAMLGRLERAFAERHASEERLRRFLADASHELRTPSHRSAATRSCFGRVRRAIPRTRSGPCGGSRTRPRAWACSSRTC